MASALENPSTLVNVLIGAAVVGGLYWYFSADDEEKAEVELDKKRKDAAAKTDDPELQDALLDGALDEALVEEPPKVKGKKGLGRLPVSTSAPSTSTAPSTYFGPQSRKHLLVRARQLAEDSTTTSYLPPGIKEMIRARAQAAAVDKPLLSAKKRARQLAAHAATAERREEERQYRVMQQMMRRAGELE